MLTPQMGEWRLREEKPFVQNAVSRKQPSRDSGSKAPDLNHAQEAKSWASPFGLLESDFGSDPASATG